MVVRLSKFFAYTLFFLLALMYFTPKVSLYYLIESKLLEHSVIIDKEIIMDNGLSLNIESSSVNVKSIESAKIENINIKIFGIYNKVTLQNIKLSSVAASMFPIDISSVDITYNIFNPLQVSAEAIGGFGEAQASFMILDMALHLDLKPSKKMLSSHQQTLRSLKKSKEGDYSYDKIIKL